MVTSPIDVTFSIKAETTLPELFTGSSRVLFCGTTIFGTIFF